MSNLMQNLNWSHVGENQKKEVITYLLWLVLIPVILFYFLWDPVLKVELVPAVINVVVEYMQIFLVMIVAVFGADITLKINGIHKRQLRNIIFIYIALMVLPLCLIFLSSMIGGDQFVNNLKIMVEWLARLGVGYLN